MYLISAHGTVVVRDGNDGRLLHAREPFPPQCDPVELPDDIESRDGGYGVPILSGTLAGYRLFHSRLGQGVNLVRDGLLMCADLASPVIACDRLEAGHWEMFHLAPSLPAPEAPVVPQPALPEVQVPLAAPAPVMPPANAAPEAPISEFLGMMVDVAAARTSFQSRIVYEIGSDLRLDSARAMVAKGARLVLATNIGGVWTNASQRNAVVMSRDIRGAEAAVGEDSVDIVYGVNILEHLNDLPAALASIRKILVTGGYFFLHGHPIWSGPTGHHALWFSEAETIEFGFPSDPLPPWSHLYMTEAELVAQMLSRGVSETAARALGHSIAQGDDLNRLSLAQIDRCFRESGLQVLSADCVEEAAPDAETMRRISAGRWWDPQERYNVRQICYWGRKP